MSESVVVLVTDLDDDKHGEITVVVSPVKAASLIETLLEAGFAQERLHVFRGAEMAAQVTYRPVVSLATEGEASPPEATDQKAGDDGDPPEFLRKSGAMA